MAGNAEASAEILRGQVERRQRQLRSVAEETDGSPAGGGKRLFQVGNSFGVLKGTRRLNPIEEMDQIARETITRLRRREFFEVSDGAGGMKRVEKKLDAPTANAITMCLRLRLDLFSQFEAKAELARLQHELQAMREVVAERLVV